MGLDRTCSQIEKQSVDEGYTPRLLVSEYHPKKGVAESEMGGPDLSLPKQQKFRKRGTGPYRMAPAEKDLYPIS